MKTRYTCYGSVRGYCGVAHRTIEAAQRHVDKDSRDCQSLPGGNSYSDRSVWAIDERGQRIEQVAAEYA